MSALNFNSIALLSTTDSVDLNAAGDTEATLYTPPTGKTALVTHVMIYNMSADAASSVVTFGKTGGTCDEWRGNQTLSGLDGTTKYTVLYLDQGTNDTPESATEFVGGTDVFGVEITTQAGGACTCSINVYGTLFNT